jgi:hypothetical protein
MACQTVHQLAFLMAPLLVLQTVAQKVRPLVVQKDFQKDGWMVSLMVRQLVAALVQQTVLKMGE